MTVLLSLLLAIIATLYADVYFCLLLSTKLLPTLV